MLTPTLNLATVDATGVYDYLYGFFQRDFVRQRTMLNGTIYIDPRSRTLEDGKEKDFWHLTTRTNKYFVKQGNRHVPVEERLLDYARAERIEWVRQIITNHVHAKIKIFYHQESNPRRDIRLYLWAFEDDFVVILQKLGRSTSFLVTSFYIDQPDKRTDYDKRYRNYVTGANSVVTGCEWF